MSRIGSRLARLEGRNHAPRRGVAPIVLADPGIAQEEIAAFVERLFGPVGYWRLDRPGMTTPCLGSLDDASDAELQEAIDILDSLIARQQEAEDEDHRTTAEPA